MAKKHNEFIHKVFSYLPLISFFVIILFLYTVYMTTYLGKLLANDYEYDKTQSQPEEGYATLFLTMKTINTYTDSMVNKFQTEEVQLSNDEQKGAIYFIVAHVLLILLFLAVFRTIFTPPGYVPIDWSNATEAELYNAAEAEKLILVDNWRRRRRNDDTQAKTPTRGSVTDEEARLHTGYGRDEEETPIGQGGQGEEIGRNVEDILEDPQLVEQLNQMAFTNAMKKENKRFCGHCQMFKPPRTHHCRQCNVCILKMDHHCPWVGNCVGFRNYKYFINMVFYGVLLLWFTFATYTELVSDTLFNPSVNTGLIFLIFFAYLLNGVIGLVITGFFGFHCFLIIRGKTTLELVEGKKSGDYNQGVWGNIKNTLGTNFFFWCIPTNPHYEGDGIHFKNKKL